VSKPLLQVIIGSTRPGRVGPAVADWITARAREHGFFDVDLVDLAEVNLPMFDEPRHPRFGQYEHQHTRDWSATIARGDAFIFVIPEWTVPASVDTRLSCPIRRENKKWVRHAAHLRRSTRSSR